MDAKWHKLNESLHKASGENIAKLKLNHTALKVEKPNDLVFLTILSEVTEATTKTTEVNSLTPKIEAQQTCDAESRSLNKEIKHGITHKDVHSIAYISSSYLLAIKDLHPILSKLLPMEKVQRFFLVASSLILMLATLLF